jgi:hypothetical protein
MFSNVKGENELSFGVMPGVEDHTKSPVFLSKA